MVNNKELLEKLQRLTFANIEHIYRDSLRDSIRPIYDETKDELRKQYSSNSSEKFLEWSKEYKWSTKWNGEAYEGKLFINPQGALKWFEIGTQERYRKKYASSPKKGLTGKITGKYVFNGIVEYNVQRILDNASKQIANNIEKEYNR